MTTIVNIAKLRQTILVLDDEPAVRELITTLFEPEGFEVLQAADCTTALEILESRQIGVVLIDKNLPEGVSGLSVLREIPRLCSYTKGIVMTGYPSTDSAIEALRGQAFDYIVKPCDIDELRAKVQAALKAVEEEYATDVLMRKHAALFETVPGVVWFLAKDGIIKRINSEGANVLGYEAEDLVGQPYDVLLAGQSIGPAVHWAFKERRTGKRASRRIKAELKTASGERRIFEIYSTGTYLDDPHQSPLLGTVGVAHDITEMVRLESELHQAAKMDALGRLAGGIAHDFNNTLAVILGHIALGRRRLSEDHPAREVLRDIETAACGATRLTEQLLSFGRKRVEAPECVDLALFLYEARSMVERLIGDDITVKLTTEPTEGATALIDRGQLQQILLNLTANARDAMPEGGSVVIESRIIQLDAQAAAKRLDVTSGVYVTLRVTDTGRGMSPEVREHLFEPFFTTKNKGTGLGLATVYGIVRQAGGFIDVESEIGKGTLITVALPLSTETPSHLLKPELPDNKPGGKILIVEDEPLLRKVTRREIEAVGFEVIAVADGTTALAAHDAWQGRIDVLITDVVMPEMDGLELAEELLARQPDLRVIFVSAFGSKEAARFANRQGMRFLRKPFTGQIGEVVREVMAEKVEQRSP